MLMVGVALADEVEDRAQTGRTGMHGEVVDQVNGAAEGQSTGVGVAVVLVVEVTIVKSLHVRARLLERPRGMNV